MPRIIETVSANCEDCYRCVRVCPVNAIRVKGGQTRVDRALCVLCGHCVRECPQQAKGVHSSLDTVMAWIEAGLPVVASVDTSFAAVFEGWRASRFVAALRLLGFTSVSETAEGARGVAQAIGQRGEGGITTACPAVVSYIEKYRPQHLPRLMPLASPMTVHGRMLKARMGAQAKVVAISPCAAQKAEAYRADVKDAVDAVLNFDEVLAWMEAEDIHIERCPESGFDMACDPGEARLAPLEGGLLHAAGVPEGLLHADVLHVSGAGEVIRLLDTPADAWPYRLAELRFCEGGCIGGPCMPKAVNPFDARRAMVRYAAEAQPIPGETPEAPVAAAFRARPVDALLPPVSEAQIEQILEGTGKGEASARLNCGACGYNTCRDNAIAVARGIAEPGMCLAYVRKRAERRANHIIENSPNGIVVVDVNLNIVHMNARFLRMFGVSGAMVGQPAARIVDPEGFEKLLNGETGVLESIYTREGMKYQVLTFMLPGDKEITGIYVDVSSSTFDAKQVDLIKDQSLKHARELLEHQIRFSQEMAHYLGRSTAQTEELVKRLMDMYAEGDGE